MQKRNARSKRSTSSVIPSRRSSELAAQVAKARGKPVEHVNAALALIGRGSPDREFYEALLKRLSDTAQVPDSALVELAAERARAVTSHLSGALAPERAEARTAAAPGSAQVKLTLDAVHAPVPDKAGGAQ